MQNQTRAINRATSLYLDVARFGAAFTVFLAHFGTKALTGGVFWQFKWFGYDAVIVFFVLSGLVIAATTSEKDIELRLYVLSRLSRLYSVVVPAIILTLLADRIGHVTAPQFYTSEWQYADSYPVLRVLCAVTFTSFSWYNELQLFSNGPYWSLCFEAAYYALFGAAHFLSGGKRWIAIAVICAIAGPRALLMLPLWLMVVAAYRIIVSAHLSVVQGILLWTLSVIGAVAVFVAPISWLDIPFPDGLSLFAQTKPTWAPHITLRHVLLGVAVATNFIGVSFSGYIFLMILHPVRRLIRRLAGMTFSLYLFHFPLLCAYAATSPWSTTTWPGRAYLFVAVLITVFLLSFVSEHRRAEWRSLFALLIPERGVVSTESAPTKI